MNPKLFSFVLVTVFCVGFVRGTPVGTNNATDSIRIVPTIIPTPAVTPLVPSTKDLKPENKTSDAKNGTVISDKTTESHPTQPAHTDAIIPTPKPPAANITINNTTNSNSSTNANSNKTQDDKNSTIPTSPTPAVTPTKAVAPSEVTTTKPSTTPATVAPTAKIQEKEKDRGFDGPSFIGGIVLALGLTGIGFVAYKFCKARTDRNYRNL